jgi:hypothetical protein
VRSLFLSLSTGEDHCWFRLSTTRPVRAQATFLTALRARARHQVDLLSLSAHPSDHLVARALRWREVKQQSETGEQHTAPSLSSHQTLSLSSAHPPHSTTGDGDLPSMAAVSKAGGAGHALQFRDHIVLKKDFKVSQVA